MKRLIFLFFLVGLFFWSCEEESEESCNDLATAYFNSRSAWSETVEAGNDGTEECEAAKISYKSALDAGCDKWGYTQAGLDSLDSLCTATAGDDGDGDGDGEPDCETLLSSYGTAGQSWMSSEFNFDSCSVMTSAADAFLASGCDTTGTRVGDYNSTVFTSDSCSSYSDDGAYSVEPPDFIKINLIDRE